VEGGVNSAASKADWGELPDAEWANQFFMTQIYDAEWNPDGVTNDAASNNCGPASLAMLMAERGPATAALRAEQAIDHARAMMYPSYPEIDEFELAEGAFLYEDEGLVFVDDDTNPVYFDRMETEPSLPQGIENGGATAVFGASWDDLDGLLDAHRAVIAYGHITQDWRDRFPGDYGEFDFGAVPHFIAVFPSTMQERFIVCDPMHRGGAVVMAQTDLQAFFQSPVSVYDTTIRLVAWEGPDEPDEVDVEPTPAADPYAMALDVHAHRVTFDEDVVADAYQAANTGNGFRLTGTEFWQKWAGGENPTYSFNVGTDYGRRCMLASAKRFEAIMADPPQGMLDLRTESNWSGSFFNWNDDYSLSDWGDGQSARLWAWRTGLIKWISQTNKDGSCYLPTLEMVESLSERCLQKAEDNVGEIVGCKAS